MKKNLIFSILIATMTVVSSFCQKNEIFISAELNPDTHEIYISQTITFFNNSDKSLDSIYLHNWANAYRDNTTPLSKRFLSNYNKEFYFSKEENRGYSKINTITINNKETPWIIKGDIVDIISIPLDKPLKQNENLTITAKYVVKIPIDKYTGYGRNISGYNLRYWYLTPALFDEKWNLMSNLDMDDLLIDYSNYKIQFTVPDYYAISSEFNTKINIKDQKHTYILEGENRTDIELHIGVLDNFKKYETNHATVTTNINSKNLEYNLKRDILNRELAFIENILGKYPHDKIFINSVTYTKNPVYGLNQLPKFLKAFPDNFEWDIKMFKALTKVYLSKTLLVNQREDYWLSDGIQTYLMMQYVNEFYPEIKATGNLSKIWGYRSFNLAKLDFNDKYPFVYQFSARKNFDQALTTPADSLSNFNRKIISKYKAGLGLRYLDEYLDDSIIPITLKKYYEVSTLKHANTTTYQNILINSTDKDLTWFFGDYISTAKKIDYRIKRIDIQNDTAMIIIKNNKKMSVPVALYGIRNDSVVFKNWYPNIDSIGSLKIPSKSFDKLSLNYEYTYPELNLRNNWKRKKKRIFHRPVQLKLWKDVEDPYYNQLYYTPQIQYNFYDGIQLGMAFSNSTLLRKNFTYKVIPYYAIKSNNVTGGFNVNYQYLPLDSKIYKYNFGMGGSYYHYAPDLAYRKFTPYVSFLFNRKSLRDVGGSAISLQFVDVNRDPDPNAIQNPESNKYSIFNLSYGYSKPEIIKDLRYTIDLEASEDFSKINFDLRYRRLTDNKRQLDFRLFAGKFLHNNTTTDFFSYGLTRQSDYLFRLNYFGRSETSGFFSQQYVTTEGGFKSDLNQNYANDWITSFNSSIGIWRWVEIYNDIAAIKSSSKDVFIGYENGIRLNFVHEFLELYFPIYTNNGWEIADPNYATKIRFVFVADPKRIIGFLRRGFY